MVDVPSLDWAGETTSVYSVTQQEFPGLEENGLGKERSLRPSGDCKGRKGTGPKDGEIPTETRGVVLVQRYMGRCLDPRPTPKVGRRVWNYDVFYNNLIL